MLMTWVNVGEVVYIVERERGKSMVHRVLGMLEATALEIVDAGRDLTLLAAEIRYTAPAGLCRLPLRQHWQSSSGLP